MATARASGADVVLASGEVVASLSGTVTPQGMVGVCRLLDASLPDLLGPDDLVMAASACLAAGTWCGEAEVAQLRRRQLHHHAASEHDLELLDEAQRHLDQSGRQLALLAALFLRGAEGHWQRFEAVSVADDLCHRLDELVMSPWS